MFECLMVCIVCMMLYFLVDLYIFLCLCILVVLIIKNFWFFLDLKYVLIVFCVVFLIFEIIIWFLLRIVLINDDLLIFGCLIKLNLIVFLFFFFEVLGKCLIVLFNILLMFKLWLLEIGKGFFSFKV